jgi:GR25 family glycosyltransferase involved in LPS biosynthesis
MKNGKKILIFLALSIIIFLIYLFVSREIVKKRTKEAKAKIKALRENKEIDEYFKNFPKYYINLDRSKDRRENMEKEIATYDLKNIKRIKAFDGKEITNNYYGEIDGYKYENIGKHNNTNSQLAVTMSHIKTIMQIKEDGHDYALVFEDDVEFTLVPHWSKNLEQILSELPSDTDMLLLAMPLRGRKIKIKKEERGPNGVAYIITPSGIKKLEKYLYNKVFNFHNYNNIVWDRKIIEHLNCYNTGQALFLPFNFSFGSTNDKKTENQQYCHNSYQCLKTYD